ncbi:MAG: hypothetical protein AABX47_02380 [Nanoarchaeota archaeon]
MTTTIQVTEDVLGMLKRMRDEQKADSYNTALRRVLLGQRCGKSMKGFLGKKMKMDDIMRGLRDKED